MAQRSLRRAPQRTDEQRHYDAVVQLEGKLTGLLNEIPRQTLGALGSGSPAAHRITLHALHAAEGRLADAVRLLELVRAAEAPRYERSPAAGGP